MSVSSTLQNQGKNSRVSDTAGALIKSTRLLNLDVFRGLAALAVLFYHYTVVYVEKFGNPDMAGTGFTFGFYGVQLFFIISGFVIFLTLQRTRHPLDFVVSRTTRIFPLYWVAVILAFFILTFSPLPVERPGMAQVFANFLLFQKFIGFDYLDGVYWSLLVEMYFYFWMLMIFITGQLHRIIGICWAWLGLVWIAYWVEMLTGHFSWYTKEFFLLTYAHLFVAGIVFYRAYEHGWKTGELALLFFCWVSEFPAGGWPGLMIVALFFVFFILFVNRKLDRLALRPLVFLGSISYALYLVHQNLGFAVMIFLEPYGLPNSVLIMAALVVSIIVAALLTRFVEKPLLRWTRKIYSGWQKKLTTPLKRWPTVGSDAAGPS